MTIVLSRDGVAAASGGTSGGGGLPLSSNKRSSGGGSSSAGRFGSRYRRAVNSAAGVGSSLVGGHPLASADPASSKKDIKHRFEITAKLGSGTYGKVSLAYDHKTEREVAVKLIKKSAIENKQDLVRIRREIRIMSMLNHPNIIQIYEVFENKDKIILVMEYASGGELYDYVSKNGSLPEAEARRIFRQITSAVLYCHKNKVAHRDLKLENILLDSRNNAKIADFGLSNYFGLRNKLLTTFCGSPLYASPEIINGTPYKGPEVDCWSLGILLYTLVYGSMPFDGRDFNRMVRQIKRGAYYEPDTPSTASMLIRNMLRVNPDRRATIYDIASHWWLNLEENMPIIQELPENQITDPTPLNERAEIMVVQELADETDVFMEFGHLSAATRRKIEEFRRRRKEAEEYNEQSPIKPPKARRTSKEEVEMSAGEKMLRAVPEPVKAKPAADTGKEISAFHDPLERLKLLENRLGNKRCSPEPKEELDEKQQMEGQGPKTDVGREEAIEREEVGQAEKENGPKGKRGEEKETEKEPKRKVSAANGGTAEPGPAKRKPSMKRQESATAAKKEKENECKKEGEKRQAAKGGGHKTAETAAQVPRGAAAATPATAPAPPPPTAAPTPTPDQQRPITDPQQYWRLETDSLNALMNQVLEQMERGPVSINLIARIQAHSFYDERPEVKELLESIIAAQPASVQKQTSKLIQQTKEIGLRQGSGKAVADVQPTQRKKSAGGSQAVLQKQKSTLSRADSKKVQTQPAAEQPPSAEVRKAQFRRKGFGEERRWHSVEVGFSTDSSSEEANAVDSPQHQNRAETTVVGTPTGKVQPQQCAPRFVNATRVTRSEPYEELEEEDMDDDEDFYDAEEEEEEEYESEIDELAQVVEQVEETQKEAAVRKPSAPKIVESGAPEQGPTSPTLVAEQNAQHLSTLERGLAKRVSKGKYQFMARQSVEMYGRGVSAEAESPPPAKRRIGGPQPRPEHSPILFDKAKDYIMQYPNTEGGAEEEERQKLLVKRAKAKGEWTKSRDPDVASVDNSSSSAITPSMVEEEEEEEKRGAEKGTQENKKEGPGEEEEESEEEEEEEEEEDGATPFRPRPSTIIGFRTIQPTGADGVPKEAPIVQVKPQTSQPQSPVTKAASPPQRVQLSPLTKNSFSPSSCHTALPPSPPIVGDCVPVILHPPESASRYIRRKNRERRARNMTVAVVAEDAWTTRFPSMDREPPGLTPPRKNSGKLTAEQKADSLSGNDNTSPGSYHRTSYLDKRKQQQSESNNYSRQNYVDRRKSFHEMSPPSDEVPYDRYAIAGGYFNSLVGNSHMPSNISRYEDEVYNAFKHFGGGSRPEGWTPATDPNRREKERFEVYKTMAERAAEFGRNDTSAYQHRMSAGGSCYYPGERPLSSYGASANSAHLRSPRIVDDGFGGASGAAHQPYQRRSVYDELERPVTPGNNAGDYVPYGYHQHHPTAPEPESPPGGARLRRRIGAAAMRDVDGRRAQYATRSQSNDHLYMRGTYGGGGEELEYADAIGTHGHNSSRYTTPEIGMGGYIGGGAIAPPDYAYVAYHDTAASSGAHRGMPTRQDAMDMNAVPARGILKNKPSFEGEGRPQPAPSYGVGTPAHQAGLIGRMRRHLSVEKSHGLSGDDYSHHPSHSHYPSHEQHTPFSAPRPLAMGRRYGGSSDFLPGMSGGMVPPSYQQHSTSNLAVQTPLYGVFGIDSGTRDFDQYESGTAARRRSGAGGLLNLARRRTTEVRLLPEGNGGGREGQDRIAHKQRETNILLDEEFKRPPSPIDRIKSLFRGSSKTKDTSTAGVVPPSASSSTRFSSAIGGAGTTSYGGTTANYGYTPGGGVSGYKRYGAGSSNYGAAPATNYGAGNVGYGSRYGGGYGRSSNGSRWYDTDTHL